MQQRATSLKAVVFMVDAPTRHDRMIRQMRGDSSNLKLTASALEMLSRAPRWPLVGLIQRAIAPVTLDSNDDVGNRRTRALQVDTEYSAR